MIERARIDDVSGQRVNATPTCRYVDTRIESTPTLTSGRARTSSGSTISTRRTASLRHAFTARHRSYQPRERPAADSLHNLVIINNARPIPTEFESAQK